MIKSKHYCKYCNKKLGTPLTIKKKNVKPFSDWPFKCLGKEINNTWVCFYPFKPKIKEN